MGILDFISNNWQQILGGAPDTFDQRYAAGGPINAPAIDPNQVPMPQPRPALPGPIDPASGGFSPSGAVDGNALTPNPAVDWTSMPNIAGGRNGSPDPYTSVPIAGAPQPGGPSLISPAAAAPAANLPPQQRQTVPDILASVGPPVASAPPPGAPLNILPPNQGGGAPAATDSLSHTLGATPPPINPSLYRPNPAGTFMAGLGKGLSTVQGNTAGGAFARGAGGAITGGSQYNEQQKTQLFNQSSTAFKDMLAARNQDDVEGYRRAQAAYLNSRAQAIQLGGGTGSGAWQNTPYGKTISIENEAQKYEKGQQILLQKRWTLNGTSPDQQQADLDNLQKQTDAYRQRLYKSAGIDPKQGANMMKYGTSSDNPFPTKGMTIDQFNEQVPMGAWYLDQNGTPRQRTVGPSSGANAQPQSASSPGQDMQAYYDTSMANSMAQ